MSLCDVSDYIESSIIIRELNDATRTVEVVGSIHKSIDLLKAPITLGVGLNRVVHSHNDKFHAI